MTPLELKDLLITVLGSELGTFTASPGKTYPAIWISPPLIDPSWKVSGLQVAIARSPEVRKQTPLTGEKLKRQWWFVELVQHDVNKSVQPAVNLIEHYFPIVVSRVTPQNRTDFESARMSVYDPVFVGLSGAYGGVTVSETTPPVTQEAISTAILTMFF